MANACRDAEALRFDYSSHSGAASTRAVEPYRLVRTSHRWYPARLRSRSGRMADVPRDRIQGRPKTAGRFRPRPLPAEGVAAYVSKSVSTDAYPDPRARDRARPRAGRLGAALGRGGAHRGAVAGPLRRPHRRQEPRRARVPPGFMGFEFEVREPRSSSTSSAAWPSASAGPRGRSRSSGRRLQARGEALALGQDRSPSTARAGVLVPLLDGLPDDARGR